MKYSYKKLKKNEQLYDSCDRTESNIVHAEYQKSVIEEFQENPLIEAIPFYLGRDELAYQTLKVVKPPKYDELHKLTLEQRIETVKNIDKLMLPMDWHYSLQKEIYDSITRAYATEKVIYTGERRKKTVYFQDEEIQENYRCKTLISEGNPGFSLTGISGCGKSKALRTLLDRIPQVIVHFAGTDHQFIQITWLMIVCKPNKSMTAIYDGLAEAIDNALENVQRPYTKMMQRKRTLAEKMILAATWVTDLKIGLIILDEIEFLVNKHVHSDSLSTILTLNNDTGVTIAIAGTETDKTVLFPDAQMQRRFGKDIEADAYCKDVNQITKLLKLLFSFQWFYKLDKNGKKKKVELTSDVIQELLIQSRGTIAGIKEIYKEMNVMFLEYENEGKIAKINREFVKEAAFRRSKKTFEGIEYERNSFNLPGIKERNDMMNSLVADIAKKNEEALTFAKKNREDIAALTDATSNLADQLLKMFKINKEYAYQVASTVIVSNQSASAEELVDIASKKIKERKYVKNQPAKKEKYDIKTAAADIIEARQEVMKNGHDL